MKFIFPILAFLALVIQTRTVDAATVVVIDSSFANGNGSFEFDGTGGILTSGGQPGGWIGAGALTIDGTDTIAATTNVIARNDVASNGALSLIVRPDPNNTTGGILDTGYALGAADSLMLSFDWQKTDNRLGQASFDFFAFTSSDNTLGGTLTSVAKGTFGSGPLMTAFETATLGAGDFTITGSNAGQNLWLAFSPGGFSGASNTSNLNIDNISLTATAVPEPSSLALLSLGLVAVASRRRRTKR